jgi:hypothetical protein
MAAPRISLGYTLFRQVENSLMAPSVLLLNYSTRDTAADAADWNRPSTNRRAVLVVRRASLNLPWF